MTRILPYAPPPPGSRGRGWLLLGALVIFLFALTAGFVLFHLSATRILTTPPPIPAPPPPAPTSAPVTLDPQLRRDEMQTIRGIPEDQDRQLMREIHLVH